MILAAGKGTRLRPITDRIPKALVEVNGVPLVKRLIDKLASCGFRDITVNVHHFADMLCGYLSDAVPPGMRVRVSSERESLLGTGGALKKAAECLLSDGYDGNVLVHNVDIISDADLRGLFAAASARDATLLVSPRDSSRRLLFRPGSLQLAGWRNEVTGEIRSPYKDLDAQSCKSYAFSGIHVISARLLREMSRWPDIFSVIDFYLSQCAVFGIRAEVSESLRLLDVGKTAALAEACTFEQELDARRNITSASAARTSAASSTE